MHAELRFARFGRGILYVSIAAMLLPVLFSLTAPNVSAADGSIDGIESGWDYTESDPSGRFSDDGVVMDWYTEGAGSRKMTYDGLNINAGDYMRISRSVSLSRIENLKFDYKKTLTGGGADRVVFRMMIGSDNVWTSPTGAQEETGVLVDVSGYSGLQTIAFEYIHTGGSAWNESSGSIWVDNLWGEGENASAYQIQLYWEDNNQTISDNENRTLFASFPNYAPQERTMVGGTLDILYPERPDWLKLTYGSYWRALIPTVDNGAITFWITPSPDQYSFYLQDYTAMYGPNRNGQLLIMKWIGSETVDINGDYWGSDWRSTAWLITGEKYQIWVRSDGAPLRIVGPIDAVSPSVEKTIEVQVIFENVIPIFDYVYWAAWRIDNNTIRTEYQDNYSNTTTAHVGIYDGENRGLQVEYQPDNEWFVITWTGAESTMSYEVVLTVQHENYGDFVMTVPVFTFGWGPPGVGGGVSEPWGLPLGATIAGIGSAIFVVVIGLSFDALRVQMGMIAMALSLVFVWLMGFLPLPGPYGGTFTATLIMVMAVLFALTWRRGK